MNEPMTLIASVPQGKVSPNQAAIMLEQA